MKIPLNVLGKLREHTIEHYKRKILTQELIIKYIGGDSIIGSR